MAKVKFGNGVAEIRGSIAGNVYSKNSSGNYIRNKTKPYNPQTISQTGVRALFSTIAQVWRTLLSGERDSFVAQAPFYPTTNSVGDTVVYTGSQLHQKHNLNLSSVSAPYITSQFSPVPITQPIADLLTFDTSVLGAELQLTNLVATSTDERISVEATPILSSGIKNPNSFFKFIDYKSDGVILGDFDITTNWELIYGNDLTSAPVGSQIWVRLSTVNMITGQATPYAIYLGIAV